MDNTTIQHSVKCEDPGTVKKQLCKECKRKYQRANEKLNRLRKQGLTTDQIRKKSSLKYASVLCEFCLEKPFNDELCEDCKTNVRSAQNKVYLDNKRRIVENKTIIGTSNGEITGVNSSNRGVKRKRQVTSKYSNLFCPNCQEKSVNEICGECKKIYNRAVSKNHYNSPQCKKKVKLSIENSDPTDQVSATDQALFAHKKYSRKTVRNRKSLFKTSVTKSPTASVPILIELIKDLPKNVKDYLLNQLGLASKLDSMVELCTIVINGIKKEFGERSDAAVATINIIRPYLEQRSISDIQNICRVSFDNAKKVKNGEKMVRKVYNKKITQTIVNDIQNFLSEDDISRVDPSQKHQYKNLGKRRNMSYTMTDAYILFKSKFPEHQVSFSKFNMLRPKNITVASKTPMLSSLCPFCLNIRIKLQKIHIKGVTMEYHLFNKLVCSVTDKLNDFEKESCISKQCEKCQDWAGKIETLLSDVEERDSNISWHTWEREEIIRKNGIKGSSRNFVSKNQPFEVFKNELINDILHPLQRVSFVEHFMAQKIQYRMYKDCLDALKVGQCILVQDFAKNRDISFQDLIKENYWTKKQDTMHPTVLFFRLSENGDLQRLVITHLSDITTHDAHIVHYMTQDCIATLKEKHLQIHWTKFFIWSDGCAAQYKGSKSFYYLDKFDKSVEVERHFFASEHGKGPSDAETGLMSMQLSNAIKSRRAKIENALQMRDFFIKTNEDRSNEDKDETRIFKLVTQDNIQHIMKDFEGIKVNTLEGNCTRCLHNIKPSGEKGYLFQRPFSCFCSHCQEENFQECVNKGYTKGEFQKHRLPTNEKESDIIEENVEELTQFNIEMRAEKPELEELEKGDYVIVSVPLESRNKKCQKDRKNRYYVAKITAIEDEDEIGVDYFVQEFDYPQKFKPSTMKQDINQGINLSEILMILPEPCKLRGDNILFPRKINLER